MSAKSNFLSVRRDGEGATFFLEGIKVISASDWLLEANESDR